MLRGIYSSASGMLMEMDKVSMHAANIANAQSAGYRRHEMTSIPFRDLVINVMNDNSEKKIGNRTVTSLKVPVGTGSFGSYELLDNSQGSLKPTGKTFDIGIQGNGWLTMQKLNTTGVEGQFTTRNGSFLLNDKGEVVNSVGDALLDKNNKKIVIALPKGGIDPKTGKLAIDPRTGKPYINPPELAKTIESRIIIKANGDVYDNDKKVATLKIQTDTDQMNYVPSLKLAFPKQEEAKLVKGNLVDKDNKEISLKQGFIEDSNVQIISEMVGLIHASKNYESGHKLIMSEDKVLDKAINELGRTG